MEPLLRTVWLYGKLKRLCGVDKVQVRGNTVKELVEAVSANYKKELTPTMGNPRLMCRIKGYDTPESLVAPLEEDDIHLYPCLMGAGGGGSFWKIVVGALLIVAAFYTGGASLSALTALGGSALAGQLSVVMFLGGAGLMLGGIADKLFPQPKMDLNSSTDVESSKYLGSNANTVKIGTPIPIIMGRHLHYGQMVSFNVDAVDVAV